MAYDDQMSIRTYRNRKEAFIQKARAEGSSAADLINKFMEDYLSGRIASKNSDVESRLLQLEKKMAEIDRFQMGELSA